LSSAAIRAAARAVAEAHRHGVIHRDLKPANLMRDREGRITVLDFGLARSLGAGTSLSTTGGIIGTPAYMSPEQARGEKAGEASDVHSLGATLYELATGQRPFEGANAVEVIRQVIDREPAAPRRG
jgi:serine/threonine-protein kinase